MLGYIWTDYAGTDTSYPPARVSEVEAQVRAWKTWYGVKDVFLDGATTGGATGEIDYYSNVYEYTRAMPAV